VWSTAPCPTDALVGYCLQRFENDPIPTTGTFWYVDNPDNPLLATSRIRPRIARPFGFHKLRSRKRSRPRRLSPGPANIQKYVREGRETRPSDQRWATFLSNQAKDIWACDFVQTYDIWFRPLFAFFIINLGTREVVHVAATRAPSQQWTAQQLRNATPFRRAPRFIIRDRDDKFGAEFARTAEAVGGRVIKTAVRTPNMNATCERFLGSVRRECLDHVSILSERHLRAVLAEYIRYFNDVRPHQALRQTTPVKGVTSPHEGKVHSIPVLGGLRHDYRRA